MESGGTYSSKYSSAGTLCGYTYRLERRGAPTSCAGSRNALRTCGSCCGAFSRKAIGASRLRRPAEDSPPYVPRRRRRGAHARKICGAIGGEAVGHMIMQTKEDRI